MRLKRLLMTVSRLFCSRAILQGRRDHPRIDGLKALKPPHLRGEMQKPAAKATAGSQWVCPECGSIDLFIDRENGEVVCRRCGLVIDETMLDRGPEWRSYTR